MTYAEHSGHVHYVTARSDSRVALLAGPYDTHEQALKRVDEAREIALEQCPTQSAFASFGTTRVTLRPGQVAREGKLNHLMHMHEEVAPNGVSHLVIGRRCMTCGDLWRHAEWLGV